jgi:anti-sigma factor RsiW
MRNRTVDAEMDAALRRAPEVRIPAHFANRVMANLPQAPAEAPVRPWILPALTLAGAATLASLGWAAISLGWAQWFTQPSVLVTVLGMEAAASVVWAWRVYRSVR